MDGKVSLGTKILFSFTFLSLLTVLITRVSKHIIKWDFSGDKDAGEKCSEAMFGYSRNAYMACLAENSLQRNWYPSPAAERFSYPRWNGVEAFWQNGLVIENLVNFMAYADNRRYISVVERSLRSLDELLRAYFPFPSFDDMAWYGLSYLRVHEVLNNDTFLHRAREIFDWTWQEGWDSSGNCSGGMWWDRRKSDKVSITNALMLQLGIKLYILTPGEKDPKLLQQVQQIWAFIRDNDVVDQINHEVADSINLKNCSSNRQFGPTYTPGILAVGLAHISQVVGKPSLIKLAHQIVKSTIQHHTSSGGILTEPCDFAGCSTDAKVFKGIFMRSLRYMMAMSNHTIKRQYQKFMKLNAASALKNSSCWDADECKLTYNDGPPFYNKTVPVFSANWNGPFNYSDPVQQMSALDLLVSAVEEGTTCSGTGCYYDPPLPPSL